VGLDWLNTYGVRLLAPFDWRWFYGDAVFIVDPWIWVVLGTGVWLGGRRGTARPARVAIAVALCYVAAMVVTGRVARSAVVEAWRAAGEPAPAAVMVGPVPVWPLSREVILDTGDGYVTGRFTFTAGVELAPDRVPRNGAGALVEAASRDVGVRGFLAWSRFPYWTVQPAGTAGAARVTVGDMRFRARGGDRFRASAVVPVD
jgi:inner membrane protein